MILTDNSPMPFGKHRGTRMSDVPASYLFWLYDSIVDATAGNSILAGQRLAVVEYVNANRRVLESELDE